MFGILGPLHLPGFENRMADSPFYYQWAPPQLEHQETAYVPFCYKLSPRSQMFIIIIFITITQQPEQDRWAENQPTAGLSSLNEYEYENEYENGMRRSKTELQL